MRAQGVTRITVIAGSCNEKSRGYCKKRGERKKFSYKKAQYDQSTQRLELEARQLLGPWHLEMLDLHDLPLKQHDQLFGFCSSLYAYFSFPPSIFNYILTIYIYVISSV